MQVAIWDTYVTKKNGEIMHFDIIVPDNIQDPKIIYTFGKDYLRSKNQEEQNLTSKECRFCHIETATLEMMVGIGQKGYYIVEMQNCH